MGTEAPTRKGSYGITHKTSYDKKATVIDKSLLSQGTNLFKPFVTQFVLRNDVPESRKLWIT